MNIKKRQLCLKYLKASIDTVLEEIFRAPQLFHAFRVA